MSAQRSRSVANGVPPATLLTLAVLPSTLNRPAVVYVHGLVLFDCAGFERALAAS